MRFGKTLAAVGALWLALAGASSPDRGGSALVPRTGPGQGAAPVPRAHTTAVIQGGATRADVDAWLDGFMPYALRAGNVAGAVVVVVKDGGLLTARGFGHADVAARKPVDPMRTLFRPGSVSKLVTWTAVMQQVEAGKIDLDADLNTYLDFRLPDSGGKPVTMRQIMTHTGGFEEAAKGVVSLNPAHAKPLDRYLKESSPTLIYTPGTTPAYSNWATALGAYIVQRVSGEEFNAYLERHIFSPLGMRTASFRQPLPRLLKPLMARGYDKATDEAGPYEFIGPAPAGSMAATGADMARFMLAHLNGGELNGQRILRPETARLMHTTMTTLLPPLNRMALGFYETNINGRRVIGHSGDTTQFHSALHLFMDDGVGLYLSVNSTGREGAAGAIRTALFQQFADRYYPGSAPTGRVPAAEARAHAAAMTGHWLNSRRFESSFMTIAQLLSQTKVSVSDMGELVIPTLKGLNGQPRRWVEVAPYVWADQNSHERLAAKVVDGKVVRWSIGSIAPFMVFDRAPASISAEWLLPAFYFAMGVLLLTVLLWPVRFFVRRHFGAKLILSPAALRAHRWSRIAALLVGGAMAAWLMTLTVMSSKVDNLAGGFDPWLWVLQGISLVAFVGGFALLAWNLYVTWTEGRRWPAKLWSVVLLLAAAVMLWIAIAFKLFAFTVRY
jgi:CubicO group peptidase (beta-lactamase class C family)